MQRGLHEIPDEEIVKHFIVDRRHETIAGNLEGDPVALLAVKRDEIVPAAHSEIDE